MSIYATLDGIVGPQLASNHGWGDFCRWAETLEPIKSRELHRLIAEGWNESLRALEAELLHNLSEHPPEPDVRSVAQELLNTLRDNIGSDVVTVTDGMTK